MPDTIQRVCARFKLEAMSNLRSPSTGVVGAVIWVSAGEFYGKDSRHGPRIKVVLGDRIKLQHKSLAADAYVSLADPPKVLKGALPADIQQKVLMFVELNREVLLLHWNGEIDTREMLDRLQAV